MGPGPREGTRLSKWQRPADRRKTRKSPQDPPKTTECQSPHESHPLRPGAGVESTKGRGKPQHTVGQPRRAGQRGQPAGHGTHGTERSAWDPKEDKREEVETRTSWPRREEGRQAEEGRPSPQAAPQPPMLGRAHAARLLGRSARACSESSCRTLSADVTRRDRPPWSSCKQGARRRWH